MWSDVPSHNDAAKIFLHFFSRACSQTKVNKKIHLKSLAKTSYIVESLISDCMLRFNAQTLRKFDFLHQS